MMLKAIVDGSPLIACDLDEDRWIELQREQRDARRQGAKLILCSGCGGPMHTAKLQAPYLTQFFAHDPGALATCAPMSGPGESADHLALKAVVYATIRDTNGWVADVEVPFGSDVKVDVLGTKLADRCDQRAFEVQLSPATAAEIIERQRRRTSYLTQSHWLVRSQTAWAAKVPTCRVVRTESGQEIVVDGVVRWSGGRLDGNFVPAEPIPLARVTRRILRGAIHFAEGVGYLDPRERDRAERQRERARRADTSGQYVAEECSRIPVPRPLTGSKNVDRIIRELDEHYLAHPGQWPFDSDRARRFPQRDPLS